MISINTNLGSLIVQNNLKTATKGLNQAIERMTTGFKINGAKDNAANFAISTQLDTKISAYNIAEENVSMGLDLVTTASDSLSQIEDKLARIRALQEQAANGTYGDDSLKAINSEVNALIEEINRLCGNTEYNGINLFGKEGMSVANPETGFIMDVVVQTPDITVSDPTKLLEAIQNNEIIGISNAETLAELANLVNSDIHHCEGKTIVLTNDIDLSGYSNWTPIGWYDGSDLEHHVFKGDFNGNGHTISNLTITNASHVGVGLFGAAINGTISNTAMINVNISTNQARVGAFIGWSRETNVENCYATGSIITTNHSAGLICGTGAMITNSYSKGSVQGAYTVGGLAGTASCSRSFSTANIQAGGNAGGLLGWGSFVTQSYATGDVTITSINGSSAGGLIGTLNSNTYVLSCFASGSVTSAGKNVGGLVGDCSGETRIENCYASGNVSGTELVGGLIGNDTALWTITNCYSSGTVTGTGSNVGDFLGANLAKKDSLSGNITVEQLNSYIKERGLLSLDSNIKGANIGLQVGINSDANSSISADFAISFAEIAALKNSNSMSYKFAVIDHLLSKVSAKQVAFGATQNRLESALEQIGVCYENLVSTRSTIKDADVAKDSSEYIRNQILQQASATLLATANQTPSIALQLL